MTSIYSVGPTVSKTGSVFLGNLANEHHKHRIGSCKYGYNRSKKWQARTVCIPVVQPIVQSSLAKMVGPCGGSGGKPRDMDLTGVTRIVKVGIRHCDTVDALVVHFVRDSIVECTDLWGDQGGRLTEISLQPNEYIMSVRGHLGYFKHIYLVRSLTFKTNMHTYGPFGQEDGIPFELPAVDGEIIGFHGRSGTYLDAIGIYVKDASTEGNMESSISISTSTVTIEVTDGKSLVEGTDIIVEETLEETSRISNSCVGCD